MNTVRSSRARSLRVAFERSGFRVRDIRHVFGGQYLWLKPACGRYAVVADAGDIPLLAQQFAAEDARLAEAWRARIGALRQQGKVAIWGAGAKGATLALFGRFPTRNRSTA